MITTLQLCPLIASEPWPVLDIDASKIELLPMSHRDKEIEILALRQQLLVLQIQVRKPTFTDNDRLSSPACSTTSRWTS